MKLIKTFKTTLIVICTLVLFAMAFLGAALQKSYQYCPPTEEEIAQMGWFERWVYEPFED